MKILPWFYSFFYEIFPNSDQLSGGKSLKIIGFTLISGKNDTTQVKIQLSGIVSRAPPVSWGPPLPPPVSCRQSRYTGRRPRPGGTPRGRPGPGAGAGEGPGAGEGVGVGAGEETETGAGTRAGAGIRAGVGAGAGEGEAERAEAGAAPPQSC